jgi:glycerol-3-phosphate dehydrogenase
MRPPAPAHVLIIGGGGTGGALAHDLTLRGLRITLVERGEFTSGTTGRHHGLLHSGARYAVGDKESAIECIEENTILRRIAPGSFEENDGLFVAITDEDLDYREEFVRSCTECGIPVQELRRDEALRLEPLLSPDIKAAIRVPDATMDAMRMPLRFFATAQQGGADLYNYMEVVGLLVHDGLVSGAALRDRVTGREREIHADITINATGPWSEKIAAMAGAVVPIRLSPGVLLALRGRLCNMVVNRLHRPGDGDIVVPQRGLSIVGTSSWTVDDPDDLDVPEDHIERMFEEGSKMIPAIRQAEIRSAWSAARPLLGTHGGSGRPRSRAPEAPAGPPATDGGSGGPTADGDADRELSRTFKTFDHAEKDAVEGFVTITGGKATTLRGMAELCSDLVSRKLGIETVCRTRDRVLLPHTAFYAAPR